MQQSTTRFFYGGLRVQTMLALGLVSLLLGIVVASSLIGLASLRSRARQAIEGDSGLSRAANEIVIYTLLCRNNEKQVYLNLSTPGSRTLYRNQWQSAYDHLQTAIEDFARLASTSSDREQANTWRAQVQHYQRDFAQTMQRIQNAEITSPDAASHAFTLVQQNNVDQLTASAVVIARTKVVAAQAANDELEQTATTVTRLIAGIAIVAFFVAIVWSVAFPARLMRPINALQSAITRMTSGDLTVRVPLARQDEIGVLAHGFNAMVETIQQRTSDLETQFARVEAARADAEASHAQIAEQLRTIAEQREAMREMSVPILPVSADTLVMPLVGALDAQRLGEVQEHGLRALEQRGGRYLILDVTGIPVIDTLVANGLFELVQSARLLGAQVVLTGIRPEVAQTLVGLGVNLAGVTTRGELRDGIAYALRTNRKEERI